MLSSKSYFPSSKRIIIATVVIGFVIEYMGKIVESEILRSDDELIDLERISSEFEFLIGKHKWPVSSGFISNKFGEHAHPVIKSIKVKNDGIDIQTNKSSKV